MDNKKPELIVGKIYADWCGHCQALKPKWDEMKKNIGGKCEKYNCEKPKYVEIEDKEMSKLEEFNNENKDIMGGEKVVSSGYPTLFKVYGGKVEYYNEERDADKMENWFMKEVYQKNGVPMNSESKTEVLGGKKQRKRTNKKQNRKTRKNRRKTSKKRN